MPVKSRWSAPVPRCSLQQWVFGSSRGPLPDDRKLLIDPEKPDTHFMTKASYRLIAKRIALGLIDAGLKPGDRVLLFSGNNLYFPALFLGILMAGGIFSGANPSFVARELTYQLTNSGATMMFAADASLSTAIEAAKTAGLPLDRVYVFDAPDVPRSEHAAPGRAGRKDGCRHWTELFEGNLARAQTWDWTEPADPQNTTCCLNYSSGTTGVPKGVEVTHYSYVANGVGVTYIGEFGGDSEERRANSTGLCILPMYHVFGQTYFIANLPHIGVSTYIMPRFDFEKMLQHVQRFRISNLTLVPPIVVALAKHPLTKKYDLSSVERIGCGAAPLAIEVADEVEALWPKGKVSVRQGWGMTEVTCTCISWDPTITTKSGAVGEVMPNCAAKFMELDGKTEVTVANKPGELWVTGPTLMKGYWRNPEATANTIVVDADGTRWLKTGDIAFIEDYRPGGFIHVVDRLKELIKVKGNQVAPAELEGLLLERPDIADAGVVGVTIKGEELPRAYVVKAPGAKVTEQEIAKWMETKVVKHKYLKGGIKFVDVIPKNPSGKILRKFLREQAAKEVGDRKPTSSKLA